MLAEEDIKSDFKMKIVVIDDEPITRKLITRSLEDTFEVETFGNASEALLHCEKNIPDLILLDMIMPNVDGIEVLYQINQSSILCDVPVICMSATDTQETRDRIHERGASGFIKKPINKNRLPTDINAIIESINSVLSSKNNHIHFSINYNEIERDKLVHRTISDYLEAGEKVIYLTWSRGEDFFERNPELEKYIDDEQLIYLEIKPNLLSKFPYLQDISSILYDLEAFIDASPRKYHLVFEEVRNLLHISYREKSVAQAYGLASILNPTFKTATYINSRPHKEPEQKFLNKIAKIILGIRG